MQYIISEKATEDLELIWQYTYFQWSENQADRYYNLLIEKIEFIAKHTTAGRTMDDIKEDYKYFPVESHNGTYKKSFYYGVIRLF